MNYEDIGNLIQMVDILNKRLKINKDIKLNEKEINNTIKYLRQYKDILNKKAYNTQNLFVFEKLITDVSNIINIIYKLEELK